MYKLQLYKPLDWQDYLIHLMLATRMHCSPLPAGCSLQALFHEFLHCFLHSMGHWVELVHVVQAESRKGQHWQSLGESFRLLWIRLSCMHCDFQAFLSDNLLICHVLLVCKLLCDKIVGAWFDALFVLKILKLIGIHFCPVHVSSTNTMAIKVT